MNAFVSFFLSSSAPFVSPSGTVKGSRLTTYRLVQIIGATSLYWLDIYDKVGAKPLITQSLLNRKVEQISVGFVRNNKKVSSYTTIKRRPLPKICAVGTFVKLIDAPDAKKVAVQLMESLNYHGIAEIEILKDLESNELFIIEVNARPWVQYSLGSASGYPLLGFMFSETGAPAPPPKENGCWIDFTTDAFCCFSRTIGHVRKGEVSWSTWLIDMITVRNYAYFDWRDLRPALKNLSSFFKSL